MISSFNREYDRKYRFITDQKLSIYLFLVAIYYFPGYFRYRISTRVYETGNFYYYTLTFNKIVQIYTWLKSYRT